MVNLFILMDKLAATARARIAILELMKFLLSYFGVTIAMFLCMTRCVLAAEKKGIILLLMPVQFSLRNGFFLF